MIDYALRRRFSFYEMTPGFDTEGFKKHQESIGNDKFNKVVNAIVSLNHDIINDDSLGSGILYRAQLLLRIQSKHHQ